MKADIHVVKADERHISGIAKVCTDAYWATYGDSYPEDYIRRIVEEFYHTDRISKEVVVSNRYWGGYFVAVENDEVIGAGGGGMIGKTAGEIFVLYLDPDRRNEGIGSKLLNIITNQQKEFGAKEQWVSVKRGNQKGIPFYEARGFTFKNEKPGYWDKTYTSLRYHRFI
ncbi:GNAT family N-acetyltransferase [Lentibacillus sp.]|uniref:GNAT family N-acetyltransferase n=1 Tax=Lentibacillus sp. TaxID=1925746 RepID=UPI002B4AEF41|nr:GNAT family N-acetyltransferase [Lentibacillus sp.]HLS10317.1 GNAT family N-acetyltransferase [Lentibacillus sp.]